MKENDAWKSDPRDQERSLLRIRWTWEN